MDIQKIALAAITAATLIGCAGPRTIDELKADSSSISRTINSPSDYQDLYRLVLSNARRCFNVTNAIHVTGDLFTDIKQANVSIGKTNFGDDVRVGVDLTPSANGSGTTITITTTPRERPVAETIEKWIAGESTACHS